jgi:hypothetical protein
MHRPRLTRQPLPWRLSKLTIAVLVTIGMFTVPRIGAALPIVSTVLIDLVGKYTGAVFGCSVAWVGHVNGDSYDDFLIGAFRYPEIASHGQAYLYFSGPALEAMSRMRFRTACSMESRSMISWAPWSAVPAT